jgi:surfeit locus 1 family protein
MTSERPRFPIGLTIAAVLVFAACCALGVWQLQRAGWKAHEMARIEALKAAPAQPIEPVLARAAAGADVSFTRVSADCTGGSLPEAYRMTTDNGEWIARAMAACLPTTGPKRRILEIDRGLLTASRGATAQPSTPLPPPGYVTGVLMPPRRIARGIWPYVLVAERETPAPPGVTPAPYPDAADNLEYVGSYAPTWFGLAVVALCFYAAMLWRRYHPKR